MQTKARNFVTILILFGAAHALAQNTTYTIGTISGQPRPTGDGGLATQALLNRPAGLCYDSAGNLYIADLDNYRVRKVDTTGKISTVVGTGTYGYSGDNGLANAALIGTPQALAVDSAGNLYIADSAFQVVRKVSSSGTITTFAGTSRRAMNSKVAARRMARRIESMRSSFQSADRQRATERSIST